jgi:hypothetical protein
MHINLLHPPIVTFEVCSRCESLRTLMLADFQANRARRLSHLRDIRNSLVEFEFFGEAL